MGTQRNPDQYVAFGGGLPRCHWGVALTLGGWVLKAIMARGFHSRHATALPSSQLCIVVQLARPQEWSCSPKGCRRVGEASGRAQAGRIRTGRAGCIGGGFSLSVFRTFTTLGGQKGPESMQHEELVL